MTKKTFSLISGILFTLVALVHLFRIADGWGIAVDGVTIPMWISWVGLVITAVLAYYGLRLGTEHKSHPDQNY